MITAARVRGSPARRTATSAGLAGSQERARAEGAPRRDWRALAYWIGFWIGVGSVSLIVRALLA
jgi:hypothetical protein